MSLGSILEQHSEMGVRGGIVTMQCSITNAAVRVWAFVLTRTKPSLVLYLNAALTFTASYSTGPSTKTTQTVTKP